jgi:hypothetical protein
MKIEGSGPEKTAQQFTRKYQRRLRRLMLLSFRFSSFQIKEDGEVWRAPFSSISADGFLKGSASNLRRIFSSQLASQFTA